MNLHIVEANVKFILNLHLANANEMNWKEKFLKYIYLIWNIYLFVKISKSVNICLTLLIYLILDFYYSIYSPGLNVDIWHGLLPIVCRNHRRKPHGIPRCNLILLGFYGRIFCQFVLYTKNECKYSDFLKTYYHMWGIRYIR